MREINKIVDFESYKSSINKLDNFAKGDSAKITIDFSRHNARAKDFFEKFFDIADGNPEWNV